LAKRDSRAPRREILNEARKLRALIYDEDSKSDVKGQVQAIRKKLDNLVWKQKMSLEEAKTWLIKNKR